MPITREELEDRKKQLSQHLDMLTAQSNATIGAIADIDYWLSQDSKAEPTPTKEE
jgi:hypothetical protein